MKTIDLRQERVTLEELLRSVGNDGVRITSEEGHEFILEAADALDREADELGRSEKFMAFLAERAAEPGRVSLEEIESRLQEAESTDDASDGMTETEPSA